MILKTPDGNRWLTDTLPRPADNEGRPGCYRLSGKRWIKTRQQWAQKGLSFLVDSYEIEEGN